MTHVRNGDGFWAGQNPSTGGTRTYYVYDGSDVALALVGNGSGWAVQQRYVTGGVDNVVAGRFAANGSAVSQNLALISDRSGSTLAAMKADGTQESQTVYFSRNPFGLMEGTAGTGGTTSTETGYTGASTPNATGGFTYLRNRWYDPQTGRFLTQDPIGLAGGVNLYSYAGSNPVAFSDPFGLQTVRTWFGNLPLPGPQGYAGFVGPGFAAHERLQRTLVAGAEVNGSFAGVSADSRLGGIEVQPFLTTSGVPAANVNVGVILSQPRPGDVPGSAALIGGVGLMVGFAVNDGQPRITDVRLAAGTPQAKASCDVSVGPPQIPIRNPPPSSEVKADATCVSPQRRC